MKIHDLITTTEALAELCERLAKSEFVAVDTEFMRENTYWPELCLVQIANAYETPEGAVVVDVGVNRVEDASKKSGFRLVGDCAYASMLEKASAITPVPGGVGPVTVALLMRNTINALKRQKAAYEAHFKLTDAAE